MPERYIEIPVPVEEFGAFENHSYQIRIKHIPLLITRLSQYVPEYKLFTLQVSSDTPHGTLRYVDKEGNTIGEINNIKV